MHTHRNRIMWNNSQNNKSPLFEFTICIFLLYNLYLFLVYLKTLFVVSGLLIIVQPTVNQWQTISQKNSAVMAVVIGWIFTGWTRTSWSSWTRWPTWTNGKKWDLIALARSFCLPFTLSLFAVCVRVHVGICAQIEFSLLVLWYLGTSWSPRPERRPRL